MISAVGTISPLLMMLRTLIAQTALVAWKGTKRRPYVSRRV